METDLVPTLELPKFKRQRRYGTKSHYLRMGTQLWGYDWHQYRIPGKKSASVELAITDCVQLGKGRRVY